MIPDNEVSILALLKQHLLECIRQFTSLLGREPVQIALLPQDGRQVPSFRYAEKLPVRLSAFEADQKPPMRIGHVGNHRSDDRLARFFKIGQRDRLMRHSDKTALEFLHKRFSCRGKNFANRAMVTDDVDKECAPQLVAYTFVRQEIAHVEKIARVLAVERRDDLARIEIFEGHDLHLGKAKGVFDCWHNALHGRIVDGAAQYRRHLNLDLHASGADDQLGDDFLVGLARSMDLRIRYSAFDPFRYSQHGRVDRGK